MGIITISQGCENLNNKPEAVRTVSDGAQPQWLVLIQCPSLNLCRQLSLGNSAFCFPIPKIQSKIIELERIFLVHHSSLVKRLEQARFKPLTSSYGLFTRVDGVAQVFSCSQVCSILAFILEFLLSTATQNKDHTSQPPLQCSEQWDKSKCDSVQLVESTLKRDLSPLVFLPAKQKGWDWKAI